MPDAQQLRQLHATIDVIGVWPQLQFFTGLYQRGFQIRIDFTRRVQTRKEIAQQTKKDGFVLLNDLGGVAVSQR